MKNKRGIAVDKFLSGYNCAQSVLYSFCHELQLDEDLALKLACGFGAGMGRKELVCGAISGGIMVIGLKRGRGEKEDKTATEQTYRLTRELMDRFQQKHGSCLCSTLLNECDLMTEEGQTYFKENNLLETICKECVGSVVEILEMIL